MATFVNAASKDGETALIAASGERWGSTCAHYSWPQPLTPPPVCEVVCVLLRAGARVNAANRAKTTALHKAAQVRWGGGGLRLLSVDDVSPR